MANPVVLPPNVFHYPFSDPTVSQSDLQIKHINICEHESYNITLIYCFQQICWYSHLTFSFIKRRKQTKWPREDITIDLKYNYQRERQLWPSPPVISALLRISALLYCTDERNRNIFRVSFHRSEWSLTQTCIGSRKGSLGHWSWRPSTKVDHLLKANCQSKK